jgi:hypothetical protein
MSAIGPQWQFPDERQRIRNEAARFRLLSSSDRFERILDLLATGESLMNAAPRRDAARRLREQDEQDWRRRIEELFAQYEAGILKSAGAHQGGPA